MDLLYSNDSQGQYPASYYALDTPQNPHPTLQGDRHCDVCIVGAGYTGLSAALHLARAGASVIVLDAHRIGWGASGRNGGQAGIGFNSDQHSLEKKLGASNARKIWQLSLKARQTLKSLIDDNAIDCEWQDGLIAAMHRKRYIQPNNDYIRFLAKHYHYHSFKPLDAGQLSQQLGTDVYPGGVIDTESGHLHPLKLALALGRLAVDAGAEVFENSRVVTVTTRPSVHVKTEHGQVSAHHVIVACNGYLGKLHQPIARKVMPINNFIVATEPLDTIAPEILPDNPAVFDSRFVVNYFRRTQDNRLLFGGGENYGYRFPDNIGRTVSRPMLKIFPQLADAQIDYAWGGTLAITYNRMPFFFREQDKLLCASGYSGHGVCLATLAGKIIADTLAGDTQDFDTLASVPHLPFPGGNKIRGSLMAAGMRYYALLDRVL